MRDENGNLNCSQCSECSYCEDISHTEEYSFNSRKRTYFEAH